MTRTLILIAAMLPIQVAAHDAIPTAAQPLGWKYGWECCSTTDCRDVPDEAIEEGPDGFVIKATGELIPYGDKKRIKQSKDQYFHLCTKQGRDDTAAICLYVPNKGV